MRLLVRVPSSCSQFLVFCPASPNRTSNWEQEREYENGNRTAAKAGDIAQCLLALGAPADFVRKGRLSALRQRRPGMCEHVGCYRFRGAVSRHVHDLLVGEVALELGVELSQLLLELRLVE